MGQQISLIDQTQEDARQKLRDIVMVAYDSLDPALKRELPITRSNTGELAVKFVKHEEAATNSMFAGTHAEAARTRSFGFPNGALSKARTLSAPKKF